MTRPTTKRMRHRARAKLEEANLDAVILATIPDPCRAACLELDVEAMMSDLLPNQSTQLIDDESGGIDLSNTGLYLEAMDERRYADDLVDNIMLSGHASMGGDACGKWGIAGCINTPDHPKKKKACVKKVPFSCNSKNCNVCHRKWHAMTTAKEKDRLLACVYARQDPNMFDKPRKRAVLHIAVSPSPELHADYRDSKRRKKMRKRAWDILKRCGDFDGAMMIEHAYRFKDDFKRAELSPHFHFMVTGWLDYQKVAKHYARSKSRPHGLGHKVNYSLQTVKHISTLRTERDIGGTISYLLSHATSVIKDPLLSDAKAEHTVRWYGKYSYNQFSHVSESAFLHIDQFTATVEKAITLPSLTATQKTGEMRVGKDGREYAVTETVHGTTQYHVSTVIPTADIRKPEAVRMVGITDNPHEANTLIRLSIRDYLASPQSTGFWYECKDCDHPYTMHDKEAKQHAKDTGHKLKKTSNQYIPPHAPYPPSTDFWYDCEGCDRRDMHDKEAKQHAKDTGHELKKTSRQYIPVHVRITRTLRNLEKSTRVAFLWRLDTDGLCPRCFSKMQKLHWLDQDNDPPDFKPGKCYMVNVKDYMPLSDALQSGLIPTVPYIDDKGHYQFRTSNISLPPDLDTYNPLLRQTLIHQNMYDEAFMRDRFEVSIGKQNILENLRLQVAAEKLQVIR